MMKLYTYFRSSAAYRIRIALNLKGLKAEPKYVHLTKNGGEQHKPDYLELNPQGLVPTLQDDDTIVTQSLAIIGYLDQQHPESPLLPDSPAKRAWVRSIALQIVCDIHPLNNLRVLNRLTQTHNFSPEQQQQWMHHWMDEGFKALEQSLPKYAGLFCFRDQPTVADVCLIPQVYNALRWEVDLSAYPLITKIYDHCMAQPAFVLAAPENQQDAM